MREKPSWLLTEKEGDCTDCGGSLPIPRHIKRQRCDACQINNRRRYQQEYEKRRAPTRRKTDPKTPNRYTEVPADCQFCGNPLPLPRHVAKKTCAACRISYQREYYRENKDRITEKNQRYYQRNAEKLREYTKTRWDGFSKEQRYEIKRRHTLNGRFGLSAQGYDDLLAKQGGGCAICGIQSIGKIMPIDHGHACCPGRKSCGKCIRGILCHRCNMLIGFLEKNKDLIPKCEAYLAKANALTSANTPRS